MTTPSIAGGAGGAEAVGELEGAEHVDAAGAGPVGAIAGGHGIGGGLDEAAEGIRAEEGVAGEHEGGEARDDGRGERGAVADSVDRVAVEAVEDAGAGADGHGADDALA